MSHIIGKGRRASETYPESKGSGGGAPGVQVPLSREFVCDATTTIPDLQQNGSEATPFATINQAIAAIIALALSPGSFAGIRLATGTNYSLGPDPVELPPELGLVIGAPCLAAIIGTLQTTAAGAVELLLINVDAESLTLKSGPGAILEVNAGNGTTLGTIDDSTTDQGCSVNLVNSTWDQGADMLSGFWGASAQFSSINSQNNLSGLSFAELDKCIVGVTKLGCTGGGTTDLKDCGFSNDTELDGLLNMDAVSFAAFAVLGGTFGTGVVPDVAVEGLPASVSFQAVAATATNRVAGSTAIALGNGLSGDILPAAVQFSSLKIPAAGESMTIDVRRINPDGTSVSILAAPFIFTHASSSLGAILNLASPLVTIAIEGQGYEVVHTYVPGGSPVMTATQVTIYTSR